MDTMVASKRKRRGRGIFVARAEGRTTNARREQWGLRVASSKRGDDLDFKIKRDQRALFDKKPGDEIKFLTTAGT